MSAQALEALSEANRIRSVRAEVKRQVAAERDVAASRRLAAIHIDHPQGECATMPVVDLLTACWGMGEFRAARNLRIAQVPHHTLLGRLTQRQRGALVVALQMTSES